MRGNEKAVIGGMFAVICGLVGFAWSAMASELGDTRTVVATHRERLAVVETKDDAKEFRLQRIEEKIDLLLERVPAGR